MSDISRYEELLSLFKAVHNRSPYNSAEFIYYCEFVESNNTTLNSRRAITFKIS